jgi:3-oxoacyl-[acyl-carrier protein] reductase
MDGPTDRLALVTGAAVSTGLAISRWLAASGARVVMLDRNAEALDCAARGDVGAVIRLVLDVRDAEAVSDRHAQLRADHGDVDILVNNAGILSNHKSADTMPDEWRNIMAVHLDGAFWLSRLCLPAIIAPACIRTPMVTEQLTEAQRQELLRAIPVGRFCEPDEVAHVVGFLSSPMAGFITSEIIDINGGLHLD